MLCFGFWCQTHLKFSKVICCAEVGVELGLRQKWKFNLLILKSISNLFVKNIVCHIYSDLNFFFHCLIEPEYENLYDFVSNIENVEICE